MNGGEPDARRLLDLARREIQQEILPQVSGEARYRLRLIANALKIAGQELADGAAGEAAGEKILGDFVRQKGLDSGPAGLRAALRGGDLDGDEAFYRLLSDITRRRKDLLG